MYCRGNSAFLFSGFPLLTTSLLGQVLHGVHDPNAISFIYVTDYTSHPDLPSLPPNEPWSRGLEGRIVKIVLWDEQVELAKTVRVGSYYSIERLRLRRHITGQQVQGRLGGQQKNVHMLNPQNQTKTELMQLLRYVTPTLSPTDTKTRLQAQGAMAS